LLFKEKPSNSIAEAQILLLGLKFRDKNMNSAARLKIPRSAKNWALVITTFGTSLFSTGGLVLVWQTVSSEKSSLALVMKASANSHNFSAFSDYCFNNCKAHESMLLNATVVWCTASDISLL